MTQCGGSWSCCCVDDETEEGVVFPPPAFLVGEEEPCNGDEWSTSVVVILVTDPLRRLMLGGITTSPDGCWGINSCVSSVLTRWEILYGRLSVVPPTGMPVVLLLPPMPLLLSLGCWPLSSKTAPPPPDNELYMSLEPAPSGEPAARGVKDGPDAMLVVLLLLL